MLNSTITSDRQSVTSLKARERERHVCCWQKKKEKKTEEFTFTNQSSNHTWSHDLTAHLTTIRRPTTTDDPTTTAHWLTTSPSVNHNTAEPEQDLQLRPSVPADQLWVLVPQVEPTGAPSPPLVCIHTHPYWTPSTGWQTVIKHRHGVIKQQVRRQRRRRSVPAPSRWITDTSFLGGPS